MQSIKPLKVLITVAFMLTFSAVEPIPQSMLNLLGHFSQTWFKQGFRNSTVPTVTDSMEYDNARNSQHTLDKEDENPLKFNTFGINSSHSKLGVVSSVLENIVDSFKNPDSVINVMKKKVGFVSSDIKLSCYVCEVAIAILRELINYKSLQEMSTISENICNLLSIASQPVCHGIIKEFLPEIYYVIQHIDYSDEDVCGFLLGGYCIGPTYDATFGWTISIPNEMRSFISTNYINKYANVKPLKVLHITDVHIDEGYVEDSIVNCDDPMCCQYKSNSYGKRRAGKWASIGPCDMPMHTVTNMLEYLSANHQFDYIMWTGDVPAHDIWQQSKSSNLILTEKFNEMLKSYFPNTAIFSSIGNHESHPANSFPPPSIKYSFQNIDDLYQAIAKSWNHFTPGVDTSTILKGGYYSHLVRPGFRIISLNSNYCHNKNWWLLLESNDPAEQLEWLTKELYMAESNQEKVHIIGHIPPGSVDCLYDWSSNFNNIITRFKTTVKAQFYGHTHLDEFEIFYDKDDPSIPINVAYIGSSVTTYDDVNPGFKIYYVDGDYEGTTREILDYEGYYLNVEETHDNDIPRWELLYSAKDAFGLNSLQASEWEELVNKMTVDDDIFAAFYKYMYRQGNKKGCNSSCKEMIICRLRKAWAGASKDC